MWRPSLCAPTSQSPARSTCSWRRRWSASAGSTPPSTWRARTPGWASLTADVSEEDFDTQIRVNLRGTWLCVRAELRQMAEQGSGSIVNVSSVNGLTAASRGVGYSIAKHGILGLTRTAAVEYAERGIRVNALCPGLVDTPLTARALELGGTDPEAALESVLSEIPLGRMATAEEIGECAAWLCLDAAPYLTGATITVDGGFTVRG